MREFVLLMALVGAMLIASPASANGNGHHNGDTINNIADTDTLVVEGDDDRRNPVASAQFSVARGACTGRGVGLQTPLAGVSAGGPDSDCVLLAGADSFDATGTPENIEMADKMRKRFFRNVMLQSNLFKTLFKMLPLVGGFLP